TASASVTTLGDGGRLATLAPIAGGYTLTVRGSGGTYKLTFTTAGPVSNTATINVGWTDAQIQSALRGLGNVGGTNATVVPAASPPAGTSVFTITFTVPGTLTADTVGTSKIETLVPGN